MCVGGGQAGQVLANVYQRTENLSVIPMRLSQCDSSEDPLSNPLCPLEMHLVLVHAVPGPHAERMPIGCRRFVWPHRAPRKSHKLWPFSQTLQEALFILP